MRRPRSLKIKVQTGNRQGEATTLVELGTLYAWMRRPEDAVRFYRQAAEVFQSIGDLRTEGFARSNAASQLVSLRRYDEARRELQRAFECKKPFGHAAEPWTTFYVLGNLERATGNTAAAAEAHRQAIQAYLAYRRDGGENLFGYAELYSRVRQALQTGDAAALAAKLPSLPDNALAAALTALLAGSRDSGLAEDPNLRFDHAAEILLLLESL